MAESYDELEPWYVHLYQRLAALIDQTFPPLPDGPRPRALDVGCGTGFATARLAAAGYETHGVDLSPALLAIARRRIPRAGFARADARRLPFASATMDAITCCGSTLSFVPEPGPAVAEMARVLRPGGRLLLECEQKWTLDLLWTLLSGLTGDPLGYGVSPRALWRALARPPRDGCWIEYPLSVDGGEVRRAPLYLFTVSELRGLLGEHGLVAKRWWGIHAVTNVIPSAVLHRPALGALTARAFRRLAAADAGIGDMRWAPHVANSVVVLAERRAD